MQNKSLKIKMLQLILKVICSIYCILFEVRCMYNIHKYINMIILIKIEKLKVQII